MNHIQGLTVSYVEGWGQLFGVPGVDMNEVEIEMKNAMETAAVFTTSVSSPTGKQQLVAGLYDCPSYLSFVPAILFASGCLGSFLGCLHSGFLSKCRHSFTFVHLFLANIGTILFLPFTVAARVHGQWYFHNDVYTALSFVISLSQVALAFQLTLLASSRCRELLNKKASLSTNCEKVTSFVIWLVALPIAALTLLNDEMLAGTIKSASFDLTADTEIYYVIPVVFGSIIPSAIILFCIVYAFRRSMPTAAETHLKIDQKILKDMKEIFSLLLLYLVCYMPSQIYYLWPKQHVSGCGIVLNVIICARALFSTLSPVIHMAYVSSAEATNDVENPHALEKTDDNVPDMMSEFGKQNRSENEEKAV